ncbi:MAG: 50S ribosomal protein L4 [Candidatus Magasanikbacteria bacterium]|jgi:large subunit ribosomal protein L4
MSKVQVYNTKGEKTRMLELKDEVFSVKQKSSVVHQVYRALRANKRGPWADTKDKGEVRGGGKKPWKQKGTGRARHGSIRSPLWKGGGVTFGPLSERNYHVKINTKLGKKALAMSISDRLSDNRVSMIEGFVGGEKTKEYAQVFAQLPGTKRKILVLITAKEQAVKRGIKNIHGVDIVGVESVNAQDVIDHQYIVVTPGSWEILEKRVA